MSFSVSDLAKAARRASRAVALASSETKDRALRNVAERLRAESAQIADANARDLEAGRAHLSPPMLDRLRMDPKITEATARGVEQVIALPDPIGSRGAMQRRPNGILVGRQRVPLGVIAMIYESRPNVTIDAASLCLKSGNAVLLRGGKEAGHTNQVLGKILGSALSAAGLPAEAVQVVPAGDRESVKELLSLSGLIDLDHLFLDRDAELGMATALAVNAKAQRPATCNALECLLVHAEAAERLLPPIAAALLEQGVELRGDPRSRELVPAIRAAADDDFGREFLDKILAVRVVADFDGALEHIARYGSNHSESICTGTYESAQRFLREVDASCVLVNASTRLNDGGELGLGCEIGTATSKLHAYGPMGLESLTTEKWIVLGEGQVRG
jgi:glutamate-5-semialdehyde dehydrogenase